MDRPFYGHSWIFSLASKSSVSFPDFACVNWTRTARQRLYFSQWCVRMSCLQGERLRAELRVSMVPPDAVNAYGLMLGHTHQSWEHGTQRTQQRRCGHELVCKALAVTRQ